MMSLIEAALATGGRVYGDSVSFSGVSTDSRSIESGELFVALSGEHFDGHLYLDVARAPGAVAAVVQAARVPELLPLGFPLLAVADTRQALGALAGHWRRQFSLPLVAITGSNGKTTSKEMLASIFSAQAALDGFLPHEAVLATQGNLNNDIGLPLTLLKLRSTHRYAVVEAGMNHPGEIAYLASLARPNVALVLNALRAHLEGMGSLEGVAHEKGTLFEQLASDGIAVLPAEAEFTALWRAQIGPRQSLSFSLEGRGDVNGLCVLEATASHLQITAPSGTCAVFLQMPGRHNALNALGAATAALAAGVSLLAIESGLNAFVGVKGRLQKKEGLNGATLYDDSYNANPDSMRAAIDVLAAQSGQRVLVLGDMGETGPDAAIYHQEMGAYAKERGIDALYVQGSLSALAAQVFGSSFIYSEANELAAALIPTLSAHTTVLVKGSRFMKMERVVALLLAKGDAKCC